MVTIDDVLKEINERVEELTVLHALEPDYSVCRSGPRPVGIYELTLLNSKILMLLLNEKLKNNSNQEFDVH